MILAIDIGGTKFSMAVFDGDRMVRRESRATDAGGRPPVDGGADRGDLPAGGAASSRWSAAASGSAARSTSPRSAWCFSTHVGGWNDFDLCGFVAGRRRRARRYG